MLYRYCRSVSKIAAAGTRLIATSKDGKKIVSVINIPINLGQRLEGPDKAPQMLRDAGMFKLLEECGWKIEVTDDIHIPEGASNNRKPDEDKKYNARNCREIGIASKDIEKKVYAKAEKDHFLLIIGGDHCLPIGTIPAIKRAKPNTAVVWVDAHADLNTPAVSGSGNMHGMPLAFLMGLVDNVNSLPSFEDFKPCLTPKDVVYIGLRDVDAPEKKMIRDLGIKAYSMYDVDRLGIGRVMEEVEDYLGDRNIHLSYDIDALDPFFAPHTGTAVRGGLTFREGNFICERLYATGKLTSMELVEVNPSYRSLQPSDTTIEMGLTLIGSAMGQTLL